MCNPGHFSYLVDFPQWKDTSFNNSEIKQEECLKVVWKNPNFDNLMNLCPKWRKKTQALVNECVQEPTLGPEFNLQIYALLF